MRSVSKAKAEEVARSIKKAFPETDTTPQALKGWNGGSDWSIVWEEGPYDWCVQYLEMAAGYEANDEEFGFKRKPVKKVKGVYCEPYYSFVMMVYPDAGAPPKY